MQVRKNVTSSPLETLRGIQSIGSLPDSRFFKALSDQNRVRLLCCLSGSKRACSLSEVAECCQIDMSVVSRHMSQLVEAGMVTSEKKGRTVLFTAHCDRIAGSFEQLAELFQGWVAEEDRSCD